MYTVPVTDLVPGAGGSHPGEMVAFQGRLHFAATTPAHGRELWRSDGSPGGTVLVTDLQPGPGGSAPASLTAWGGVLFIIAYSLLQPFGLNGLVFLLSAPLIWSPTEAFLLNWAGTVGTGLFSFYGARFVARD